MPLNLLIIQFDIFLFEFFKVRNGDNVCYMFASVLPRLFSMTPPSFIKEENRAKLIKLVLHSVHHSFI